MVAICPYQKDFVLHLQYICDQSTNPSYLTVLVKHVFTPFTKAQVMLVDILDFGTLKGLDADVPATLVLKLYDRRWIDDRDADGSELWIPEHESLFQKHWEKGHEEEPPSSPKDSLEGYLDRETHFQQMCEVRSSMLE